MTDGESPSADDGSDITRRPQDDFVARTRPSPTDPPPRTLVLTGLLGDSDRPAHRRLYFNRALDYYAEFATEDVLSTDTVPSDQPPFVGLDATRVTLRRDALVSYTHTRQAAPVDEFDLDLRLGGQRVRAIPNLPAETWEAECPGPTWGGCATDIGCGTDVDCPTGFTVCKPRTCNTCRTDCGATCDTCRTCDTCQTCAGQNTCVTCAGQNTCQTCNQATCVTCNQATCVTCNQNTCVTCGDTCATCETCNQRTCRTCDTCNPHVFTCGPRC
jgi:hypothetical protein